MNITATVRTSMDAAGDAVAKAMVRSHEVDLNPKNNFASTMITVVDPSVRHLVTLRESGIFGVDGHTVAFAASDDLSIGWEGLRLYSRPEGGWGSTAPDMTELNRDEIPRPFSNVQSVAVDGDTLVIGVPPYKYGSEYPGGVGIAHVFSRTEAGWEHVASPHA